MFMILNTALNVIGSRMFPVFRDMSDFFLNVMDGRFGIMLVCFFCSIAWLKKRAFPVHMNSHAGRGL